MLLPLSLLVVCITSSEQRSFTMFQQCYSLLFIILKQQQAKKIYSLDILLVNEHTDECTCICIWKMTMVLIVLSVMNDWNSKSLEMKYSVKKFWFLTKYYSLIKKIRRQKLQQHRVTCNQSFWNKKTFTGQVDQWFYEIYQSEQIFTGQYLTFI